MRWAMIWTAPMEDGRMRVRFVGFSAAVMLLLSMVGLIATANAAPNVLTTATAGAARPAVHTPTPTATRPAPTATTEPTQAPTETPTVTATTETAATPTVAGAGVVTLVLWYEQTPNAGPLKLGPIQINENGVAGAGDATNSKLTGTVDFEDPTTGLPKITLGESTFDGYAVTPDDPTTVLRWIYYNDDSSLRPSTLVVQVHASAGPYKDYDGSATFISRASKAGGVVVISLNPPSS
jgi:hypothetical protein